MNGGNDRSALLVCVDETAELADAPWNAIDDCDVTVPSRREDLPALVADREPACVVVEDGATSGSLEAGIEGIRGASPDLPVVAVVEDAERGTVALEAGATEFVLRQVATEHGGALRARIESAMDRPTGDRRDLEYYETLLQIIPDTVVVTDRDGTVVDLHGFEGRTGFTRDELIGEHVSKTTPSGELETAREVAEDLARDDGRDEATYETRLVSKDGEELPVENRIALLPPDEDGEIPGAMSVLRDVSDRKERQRELELKNRAIDEAPVGITMADATDPETPIVYANDAFTELTGYAESEVLGESWSLLRGPETDPSAIADLQCGIEEATPVSAEVLHYRKDATPFWTRASLSPVEGEDGTVTHFIGFHQDVTERKEYEQAIERRFDEFSQVLAQDLREPLERAITELVAARESGDEEALDGAVEWLRRTDSMLEDISIVHARAVPDRDLSETALRSAAGEK